MIQKEPGGPQREGPVPFSLGKTSRRRLNFRYLGERQECLKGEWQWDVSRQVNPPRPTLQPRKAYDRDGEGLARRVHKALEII